MLAVDLAGHGRTPRAGRSAAVRANAALLGRFLDEVVREPVVLLGNSMGAAISVLHAAARPEQVRGLALIGPALPRTRTDVPGRALAKQVALFAVPGLAERSLARRRNRLGRGGVRARDARPDLRRPVGGVGGMRAARDRTCSRSARTAPTPSTPTSRRRARSAGS